MADGFAGGGLSYGHLSNERAPAPFLYHEMCSDVLDLAPTASGFSLG